ncbi:hypothetical protein FSP39_025181 [Pinctada imbricata]|uniref:Uncharacterized protein n=1 Tax=Pinctada imbricata TaxID=66713 RepID=A0AA88YL48_PINIB|nr:hypothetical protein FSP39_025181 [Pinctada imbricata]
MFQAIFQGHISGRRLHGDKSNPIYHDTNKTNGVPLHIRTYNSVPKTEKINGHVNGDLKSRHARKRPEIRRSKSLEENEPEHQTPFADEEKSKSNELRNSLKEDYKSVNNKSSNEQDMQRESLKVTNGEVCVGDIIIENGFRNPGFEENSIEKSDHSDKDIIIGGVNESRSVTNGHMNGNTSNPQESVTGSSETNQTCKEKAVILKQELEKLQQTPPGGKEDCDVQENVTYYHGEGESEGLKEGNRSDWPEIDDIVMPNIKETEVDTKNLANGKPHMNGHIPNGNHIHDHSVNVESSDINQNFKASKKSSQKAKSERKSSKKKVRERKNSLPDHILNSLAKKPTKPILVPSVSSNGQEVVQVRKDSMVITEQKSVTFSDDTVFNENKPNKYRQERLNIRRHNADGAMASANPVFVDDDGFEISLTDDEKALRYYTQKDSSKQILSNDLNVPGYMKEYVIEGGDLPQIAMTKEPLATINPNGIEDIEGISSEPYEERLSRKTRERSRKSRIVRLTLACFAFAIVIGVVVLLVVASFLNFKDKCQLAFRLKMKTKVDEDDNQGGPMITKVNQDEYQGGPR